MFLNFKRHNNQIFLYMTTLCLELFQIKYYDLPFKAIHQLFSSSSITCIKLKFQYFHKNCTLVLNCTSSISVLTNKYIIDRNVVHDCLTYLQCKSECVLYYFLILLYLISKSHIISVKISNMAQVKNFFVYFLKIIYIYLRKSHFKY